VIPQAALAIATANFRNNLPPACQGLRQNGPMHPGIWRSGRLVGTSHSRAKVCAQIPLRQRQKTFGVVVRILELLGRGFHVWLNAAFTAARNPEPWRKCKSQRRPDHVPEHSVRPGGLLLRCLDSPSLQNYPLKRTPAFDQTLQTCRP
jgi:hypothetical protein